MTMEEKLEKQLIRLGDADLLGNKPLYLALRKIKGVSYSLANAVCIISSIEKNRKIGNIIKNPAKYGIKGFMFNRRKDRETGEDRHLISSNLKLTTEFDIKRMKMIKSYKGIRHTQGQPVRGQRTKAHFRKGSAVGVAKKKAAPAKAKS